MRAFAAFVCLAVTLTGSPAAADGERGAKDLFYDPAGGSVITVTPPARSLREQPRQEARPTEPAKPVQSRQPVKPEQPVKVKKPAPPAASGAVRRPVQVARTPAGSPARTVTGLSYWIELVGPDGQSTQVTEQRVFHSGDRIRLHFLSNTDGYINLIQLGSSGTGELLFPDGGLGLADHRLSAGVERILPSEAHWFRFDGQVGQERLLVLFGRTQEDLGRFPVRPAMDAPAMTALAASTQEIRGSKDLVIESETRQAGEIGTYGVNRSGKPVILEIVLKHQ